MASDEPKIDKWIIGAGSGRNPVEYIIHTRSPRFIGQLADFDHDVYQACCPGMPVFFGVEMLWPIVWLDPEPDHQTKIDLLEAGFAAYSLFSEMAELDNEADED
jgi:hypothetical protein